MVTVKQLNIYPVKSLRGFSVNAAILTPQGLENDRRWMIINNKNLFITQRKYPEMVLIHTKIENGHLILYKPSCPDLQPLNINIDQSPESEPFYATVWKDNCEVIDEGKAASDWLAAALPNAGDLRLVRMGTKPRPQSNPDLFGSNTHTFFADAAPFLITNTASLKSLNQHLNLHAIESVTMEHFRPNIVIEGIEAFTEHRITSLQHENYHLKPCFPCQRCAVPTIHVETAQRHPQQQPFSLLAEINAMPENNKAPAFGENAILLSGNQKVITVGDQLR